MRILSLIAAVASLVLGISLGLVRFGWDIPLPNYDLLIAHGTLMVCGFLGTLICLERAVAARNRLAFILPALCATGTIVQIIESEHGSGSFFYLCAASGLVVLYTRLMVTQPEGHALQITGAACWAIGNVLLALELPLYIILPWWLGFLLFTVAGERLELARFRNPRRGIIWVFMGFAATFTLASTVASLTFWLDADASIRVTDSGDYFDSPIWSYADAIRGLSIAGISIWLVRYDLARSALSREGLPRFSAASLLLGYGWLIIFALLTVITPGMVGGTLYDARLHTFFIGFVVSMVFGHALIIGPGIFEISLEFHRWLYLPLTVLHAGVAVRVISDLNEDYVLRNTSGLIAASAVILFGLCILFSRWLARRPA